MRSRLLLVIAGLISLASAAQASIITGYMPSLPSPNNPGGPAVYDPRFNRFSSNFPGEAPIAAPAGNLLFGMGSGVPIDLSGVGWITAETYRGLTMVSPTHFIAAAHAGLINGSFAVGNSVSFLASDGTTFTSTIAARQRVPSLMGASNPTTDILFGTLSTPVPSTVKKYTIASGPLGSLTQIGMYTQEHRVGLNRGSFLVADLSLGEGDSTNSLWSNFLPNEPGVGFNPGETFFTVGDSGSPSFVIEGGELKLLGHHMATFNLAGIDYSIDSYLPDYKTTIESLIAVPEPTSFILAGVGAVGWFVRRRRAA